MSLHPEEMRIASSLRELVVRTETVPEVVEGSLGWRAGRLMELVQGREGMSLRDLLELLEELETTPADFFGKLYGQNPPASGAEGGTRFAESQRVLRSALARRRALRRQGDGDPPKS